MAAAAAAAAPNPNRVVLRMNSRGDLCFRFLTFPFLLPCHHLRTFKSLQKTFRKHKSKAQVPPYNFKV